MMYARPREKEFMIGHPAFYLAAFAAYKQAPRLWQMLLVVGATIGQGSLVQTFAHMRTPVIMNVISCRRRLCSGCCIRYHCCYRRFYFAALCAEMAKEILRA